MNNLPLTDLREGSYFDAPVFLDENYILLSPDIQMTAELIERLKRWGYEGVHTDGGTVEAPAYTSTGAAANTTSVLDMGIREEQQMEEARKLYYSLLQFCVEVFKQFKEENRLNIPRVSERIKLIIESIKSARDAILRYPEFDYPSDNYLYAHSVNSTILALAIGDLMKLPPHRMIELGVAAVLHDIGMLKLPDAIYQKEGFLAEKEMQMIRAHTTLGYRILKSVSVSEEIALGAYEHHERLDASGYPRGLAGDKISLYSRIIAVVCSYDAITSRRLFKSHKDLHAGLMDVLKDRGRKYDEKVVRSLIICVSAFPLGSIVLLSDQAVGRVAKTSSDSPRFPFVQILFDKDGNRISEPLLVKTSEQDGVTIQRCLSPEEVAKLEIS